jgi:hypothetical protein
MGDLSTTSPLPSNADRAALAKILDVVQAHEFGEQEYASCEATVTEIQRIAVWALNERTKPGDYWHGWLPDPEHCNALPQPLRDYIHDLETRADPAGDVAQIAFLKEAVDALVIRVRRAKQRARAVPELGDLGYHCNSRVTNG